MSKEYKASEELAFNSEQNKRAIESAVKELEQYASDLRLMLEADVWNSYQGRNWTDGYVSRDVARMSGLIARQQALSEAERMIGKQEKEG